MCRRCRCGRRRQTSMRREWRRWLGARRANISLASTGNAAGDAPAVAAGSNAGCNGAVTASAIQVQAGAQTQVRAGARPSGSDFGSVVALAAVRVIVCTQRPARERLDERLGQGRRGRERQGRRRGRREHMVVQRHDASSVFVWPACHRPVRLVLDGCGSEALSLCRTMPSSDPVTRALAPGRRRVRRYVSDGEGASHGLARTEDAAEDGGYARCSRLGARQRTRSKERG